MYHCECGAEGCGLRRLRVLIDVGMVVKPVALGEWRDELEQVQDRLGELFVRPEPRQQAGLYQSVDFQILDCRYRGTAKHKQRSSGRCPCMTPDCRIKL